MDAMIYETIIREAFQCKQNGDPAKLANAGMYTDFNINKVKAALNYVIEIIDSKYNEASPPEIRDFRVAIAKAGKIEDLNKELPQILDCLKKALREPN